MKMRIAAIALFVASSNAAYAEVIMTCTYPTLPAVVMWFGEGDAVEKRMSVGGRPAVPFIEGQGSGRLITADIDGYHFRIAPANSVMDVEKDGELIISETGNCITIGAPENQTPLQISPPVVENATSPEADIVPEEAAEPAPHKGQGAWVVSEDKSAFDDSSTVVLSLKSNEPIPAQFGSPAPASLYLRCQENRTSLFMVLNDLFLSDIQGFGEVDYRVDDGKAGSVRMNSSTDNKALGLWEGGSAIPFIKTLMTGKHAVFRATPYNESPVEFSFDLVGLDTAIAPLKAACGWK